MAFLIAGIIAAGAGVGSLLTYAGVEKFCDSTSTNHVQTVRKKNTNTHKNSDIYER